MVVSTGMKIVNKVFGKLFNIKTLNVFLNGSYNQNIPIKIKLMVFYNIKEFDSLKDNKDIFINESLYKNNNDIYVRDMLVSPNNMLSINLELPNRKEKPIGGVVYVKYSNGKIVPVVLINKDSINLVIGQTIEID